MLKISANLWYLEETLERSEVSVSFVELTWISEEQRQSSKLLEPRRFDAHKYAVAPMLDHLKINIEVSDADMETVETVAINASCIQHKN